MVTRLCLCSFFFFFNDTATTEIYTLSLHDALPISFEINPGLDRETNARNDAARIACFEIDRKSTRLNSSHLVISYAVFCLKKKKQTLHRPRSSGQGFRPLAPSRCHRRIHTSPHGTL